MAGKETLTPMMEQYFRIKKEYADALLFFRLGDFYEMFYDDAKVASGVLEIALTSRQKVPMCGVPHHAVESYLEKLMRRGFKVAVCEQVEDPKQSKGVVRREVVKVLTPGTALEIDLGGEKEGSFIAGLYLEGSEWGFAVIDLAGGTVKTAQSDQEFPRNLSDELFLYMPKEIIYPASKENEVDRLIDINKPAGILKNPLEDWVFEFTFAKNSLQDHFEVKSLAGFDLEGRNSAVSAAGALLYYLKGLRRDSLSLIQNISFIRSRTHMVLDTATLRNLELVRNLRDGRRSGSFLDIIDYTVTSMGGRLLYDWLLHPLMDCREINLRQEAVAEFTSKTIERHDLREALKEMHDLERLKGKISLGVAHARDLITLKNSLLCLPKIKLFMEAFVSESICGMLRDWDPADDIAALIEEAVLDEPSFQLTEGGIIRDGFNSELDELRRISRSGKSFISGLESQERQATGISSLKIRYNRVFGYFIDVTKPNLNLVPENYIRKQTLVNSERFITPELKEYEDKVLNAEARIGELEYSLFLEIREQIAGHISRLQNIAGKVARIDCLSSLGELAVLRNYRRPELNDDEKIQIRDGRHPVIEVMNEDPFIPNDTYLDRLSDQILIITGPNMGGKSTFLRQTALICILAQMGSFVPAEEAEIGVVDRIFTRIGAMDFLSIGHSTFMVEMLETANILNNATTRSLILLDEVGRGTSTFDGLSLAWAIAEYIHEREDLRAKTLFATHYHELTELTLTLGRIKNYHVTVKEDRDDIVFLRKIVPGPSDQSYGIHVAKLAGIPRKVIDRAKEILFNLEKKELDDSGRPRIAYRTSNQTDASQFFLFEEDRNRKLLDELRNEIEKLDINRMTPVEALNLLHELQRKLS